MTPLLKLIATSRTRLAASFVALLVPVLGYAVGAAGYIRYDSSSPSFDLALITFWMLLALLAAGVGALLAADLLFPPGWREVNVLGHHPQATDEEVSIENLGAATQSRTLHFAVIFVLILGAVVYVSHLATGQFLNWYARYGYATSTLRGDNLERKLAILEQMTRAQDDRLIEFTNMMTGVLTDPASEDALQVQAIWCLGEVGRRMERSIEPMEMGEEGGKWGVRLRQQLRDEVEPIILARLNVEPARSEAQALVYALGHLRNAPARRVFKDLVANATTDLLIKREIIKVMSSAKPKEGFDVLRPLLLTDDQELVGLTAWSVGEMYGYGTGSADEAPADPRLVRILRRRLPHLTFDVQCIALDALQRVRAESLDRVLFQLFESVQPVDRRCPRQTLERRFRSPVLLSKEEEYREKIVKTLATIADGNDKVHLWLREKSRDESVASGLRRDMGHVLEVVSGRQ